MGLISRRKVIKYAAAGAVTSVSAPLLVGCGESETVTKITVLIKRHQGLDQDWALSAFRDRTGISVVREYYDSESDLLTKLRHNPYRYDLVQINSAWVNLLAEEKLLQPVDIKLVQSFSDLQASFRDSNQLINDGEYFGVAWVWGITAIAYNKNLLTMPPETIQSLWDPIFKKKVAFYDDAIEAIALGAIASGQDINYPASMDDIKHRLLNLKPQISEIWRDQEEWKRNFSNENFLLSTCTSGLAIQAMIQEKLPLGFVVPQEGGIGWMDALSIGRAPRNLTGVYQLVNYLLSPEFYAPWATNVGAPASVNRNAGAALPDDSPARLFHFNENWISRLQFLTRLGARQQNEKEALWSNIKLKLQKT